MSIEYIRYQIPAAQHDDFLKAYTQAAACLDQSKFCLAYELAQCEEETDRFILRIDWTSTSDHLNGFRKSMEFREFLSHIKPYIENIEEMQHYHPTSVVSV